MADDLIRFSAADIGLDEDSTFAMTCHPGDIALANEIGGIVGPVFLDIEAAAENEPGNDDASKRAYSQAIAEAMKGIYTVMGGDYLPKLAKRVLKQTKVIRNEAGSPVVYDLSLEKDYAAYFKRNYKALIPLMRRVMEENGFFDMNCSALVLGSRRAAETESSSESPAT
jgi:hypothetical protein